jgi:hypothetical protein
VALLALQREPARPTASACCTLLLALLVLLALRAAWLRTPDRVARRPAAPSPLPQRSRVP